MFVFQSPGSATDDAATYAQRTADAWAALPENMKPYGAMRVEAHAPDAAARQVRFQSILSPLQALNVPVFAVVGTGDPKTLHPPDLVDKILYEFTCVKGVWVSDLSFNDYYVFGGGELFGAPPHVRWLSSVIDASAQYGRYLVLRLGAHAWPHALSNTWCRPMIEGFRANAAYVIPVAGLDGDDAIAQFGMVMGLWLDGAASHWGVEATPRWFKSARFIEPGVFGVAPANAAMPPPFYRAMALNGAMCGATVYAFDDAEDLWAGARNHTWTASIAPTLREIIDLGLISRKESIETKAQVAYQLGVSNTPAEMQQNLRDIDGVYGEGLMIRGAYGIERPGQVAELIPNTGAHFWIPIFSAFATPSGFARVVRPNTVNSVGEWTQLLDQYLVPDGAGPAFVTQVGLRAFVMHTRENQYEQQAFRLPGMLAPVRGFRAVRDETTATVSWPPREGDIFYRVYKRAYPDGQFELVADRVEQRSWTDPAIDPQQPTAYSVTAATQEKEVYEGVVNYGDYLALSLAHSRIAEEAVLTPLVMNADSQPIANQDTRLASQEWWPNVQGVADENKPAAMEIAAAIERWDAAFSSEDVAGVLNVYAPSYRDPQNWSSEYVGRAYQWFFERYSHCTMARQIRQWDFSAIATTGKVRMLLYCQFAGTAASDPTGRFASVRAAFPLNDTGEVWLTFTKIDSAWRIESSEPALPNFREILSYSAGPFDAFAPGPDTPAPANP
ncbi:MAG: hypothetical protein HUU46_23290 [Candidatus Hydrogenedentes bacterium]|nr:hypothetical protein [Candidatus Hydrogenedentota bacterium]